MMSRKPYHSASHCKYLIQYHIIWCPKFRFSVLHGKADMTLKQILQKICEDYGYRIKALEVMPDHIHIFPENLLFFFFLYLCVVSVLFQFDQRVMANEI